MNINRIAQKALSPIANNRGLATVILLEGTVTAGRCYQAKKRGDKTEFDPSLSPQVIKALKKVEFNERLREETSAAAVWLFGVAAANAALDGLVSLFGKKDLVDNFKKDFGKDFTRNPSKNVSKLATGLKFSKILLSAGAAIYAVGAIVPSLNQAITKKSIEKVKALHKEAQQEKFESKVSKNKFTDIHKPLHADGLRPSFASERNNNTTITNKSLFNSKDMNFQGAGNSFTNIIKAISHNMENDKYWGLFTVDAGLIAGRSTHARNKDEKLEILIRDVGSLYFYAFATAHIANKLSETFDAKNHNITKLDTKLAEEVTQAMKKELTKLQAKTGLKGAELIQEYKKSILPEETYKLLTKEAALAMKDELEAFKNKAGNENLNGEQLIQKFRESLIPKEQVKLISELQKLHDKASIAEPTAWQKLKAKFTGEKLPTPELIDVNDVKNVLGDKLNADKAELLTKHNYGNEGKMTAWQLEALMNDGLTNNGEFIEKILGKGTMEESLFKKAKARYTNPDKFVSQGEVKGILSDVKDYMTSTLDKIGKIATEGKSKEDVVKEMGTTLDKMQNRNFWRKLGYMSAGLGVSALFLSTLIPKFQYWVTEKRTGEAKFPGVMELEA